uniref:Uncharacterized protein n=1 Tax=Physcomitrium patens TaxID=3218 RepID=A0A2K1K6L6_PHYPA|nr:hypothetical protein PHYPA_011313 [Physcomitrium patens]
MTDQIHWFVNYKPLPSDATWTLKTLAGHRSYVTSAGDIKILVQLPHCTEVHSLEQVLYMLGFGRNLFSLTKVARKYKIFTFCKDDTCELLQDNNLIMTGRMLHGSYLLDFTVLLPPTIASYLASFGNVPSSNELQVLRTWHLRLGHLHHDMICKMAANGLVHGLRLKMTKFLMLCSGCAYGKSHRISFPKNVNRLRATQPRITLDFKLVFSGTTSPTLLTAFADADYAADLDDRKCRSGYILFLNRGPISWGSEKQACLIDSTTYSKYVACYMTTKEIIWCRRLLADLGYP